MRIERDIGVWLPIAFVFLFVAGMGVMLTPVLVEKEVHAPALILPYLRFEKSPYPSRPPVDVSMFDRQSNYRGGSCMHASLISVLRWQNRYNTADYWRKNYWGGEDVPGLARSVDRKGLRYAYTTNGDTDFLEWCSETRRGAAIHYYPNHAITFCGFEKGQAVLLNNNRTGSFVRISKNHFLHEWKRYGGYALTVVYPPPSPKPWI